MQSLKEVSALVTAPGQLFEMDEVEIRGTRTRVWKHAPPSLRSILEISRLHGDKTFLVYEDERLTFEEHFRRAADVRAPARDALRRAARATGSPSRCATSPNGRSPSARRRGRRRGGRPAQRLVDGAGAGVRPARQRRRRCSSPTRSVPSGSRRLLPALGVPAIVVARGRARRPRARRRFEDVLGDVPTADAARRAGIDPDDDATIFYTSGTTGRPKGALGTHRNITTNPVSLAYAMACAPVSAAGGELDEVVAPAALA